MTDPIKLLKEYLQTIDDAVGGEPVKVTKMSVADRRRDKKQASEVKHLREQYVASISALQMLFREGAKFSSLLMIEHKYAKEAARYNKLKYKHANILSLNRKKKREALAKKAKQ